MLCFIAFWRQRLRPSCLKEPVLRTRHRCLKNAAVRNLSRGSDESLSARMVSRYSTPARRWKVMRKLWMLPWQHHQLSWLLWGCFSSPEGVAIRFQIRRKHPSRDAIFLARMFGQKKPREARDLIFKIRSCTVRSDLKNKVFSAVFAYF